MDRKDIRWTNCECYRTPKLDQLECRTILDFTMQYV